MNKHYIYLDDVRVPKDPKWIVVRSYEEFVAKVQELGLDNIQEISLDHDLGPQSTRHFLTTASKTYKFDYDAVDEKTGLDCAKWIVDYSMDMGIKLPLIYVHSANPVGSSNIMGYINNYLYFNRQPQNCVRIMIDHTVDYDLARKQGWN